MLNDSLSSPEFVRNSDRYNQITIGLSVQTNNSWQAIRVHNWSTRGFQFFAYLDELPTELLLKRNSIIFPGTVMWHARNTNKHFIVETYINELLYKTAQVTLEDQNIRTRLLRLIRKPLMLAEKIQVLESLGASVSKSDLKDVLTARLAENSGHRYGVKVDAAEWTRITREAASVSSVVTAFEKYSNTLA